MQRVIKMSLNDLIPFLKDAPLYAILLGIIWFQYKKCERVEQSKDDLVKDYLQVVNESNKDLMEATRTFDRLLQARGQ